MPQPTSETSAITLTVDEYEAIRLVDCQKRTHEQCAAQMEVSRTTVTEIYESARFKLPDSLVFRQVNQGAVIHSGGADCTGLLVVRSGQLRAYILSDEGREITIYRLFDRDICLFSASCIV